MIFYVSSLMVFDSYDICVLCMLPYLVDKHMQRPYVFLRLLFLFEPERYLYFDNIKFRTDQYNVNLL